MTTLPVEEKDSILKTIWNFIKNLFKKQHTQKCACGTKCEHNCCCDSCVLAMAYSEKESDHSEEDIYLTPEKIEVY